jgi:hypothetical protein
LIGALLDLFRPRPIADAGSLPSFFPGIFRISPDQLRALPVRAVTHDEAYELMCSAYWNGSMFYPNGVELLPGELGHDQRARYVEAND